MGRYLLDGKHPHFKPDDYDEIIVQDTDAFNSPSWLFSDRVGFRYFPTQEIVKRFGLVGYYQLSATAHQILPGQFLKRLVKSEEERNQADEYEKQSGTFAYILSGLLPCVYWTLHYVFQCRGDGGGVKYTFAAYLFGAVYLLLAVRFALAHTMVCKSSTTSLVFREYDFWWGGSGLLGCLGHILTILEGLPLLGWTGGFYIAGSVNYRKEDNKQAIAMVYLPINLFTLALFLAHSLLRVLRPEFLLDNVFVDVLGTASFYFSITDLALFSLAFPSGAAVVRRWNVFVFSILWLSWLALTIVTVIIPNKAAPAFLDLGHGACNA